MSSTNEIYASTRRSYASGDFEVNDEYGEGSYGSEEHGSSGSQWSDAEWKQWRLSTGSSGDKDQNQAPYGGNHNAEKVFAPEYDGKNEEAGKPGTGPKNYLRKVELWERLTKVAKTDRGITLFYKLKEKAWEDAEVLDEQRLEQDDGLEYFKQWIRDTYLDSEMIKVGKTLRGFFKEFKRRDEMDIRTFNSDFDKHVREMDRIGCTLSGKVLAWWYLDKLRLSADREISLLASINNEYNI
jgi:hypothetical protein